MNATYQSAHLVALTTITQFAPQEAGTFELIWSEYMENPDIPLDEANTLKHSLGSGAEQEIALLTTIIIPIAVSIATHVIQKSVDAIIEHIQRKQEKKSNKKLNDDKIREIAIFIVASFDRQNNSDRTA